MAGSGVVSTNVVDGGQVISHDPFFISHNDNPNSSLVAAVFSGNNYVRWSRSVRRALGAKNKEGFINGEFKKPDSSDANYIKWKRADYMVTSWILSFMTTNLADDFAYSETTQQLWEEIQERFGQSNGPLVYQLKKELAALRQENATIVAYYGKINPLSDELYNLRALLACNCGAISKCTYEFLKRVQDFEEEDKLMQFLLGLNNGYDNATTYILSMQPLPNMNKAFSVVQRIEKQKEIAGDRV